MYKSIDDIPNGAAKRRLQNLPGLTLAGTCNWIERYTFDYLGFKTGNGMMRRGTPEGFPQGLIWETKRKGNTITHIRCIGFSDEEQLTHRISPKITKALKNKPCMITGSTSNIEIDHRAGNKLHPLHIHTDDVKQQKEEDFMPLCRAMNQIKRQACKKCVKSNTRPNLPPFLGGGPMLEGEGCNGCFWYQPELYGANNAIS